jgi:hypoxanthine-DNA glycosylase
MSSTRSPVTSESTALAHGFAPVARADARVLILGSLPSQRSIARQQYYGHPQNAFWRIMGELVGATGSYAERCAALVDHRIALWDVLEASVRPGSMDADIDLGEAQVNDFILFFDSHTDIRRVCFNGQKAAQMFERFAPGVAGSRETVILPSTSPAFASMRFEEKLRRWRAAVLPL